jgi:hypothetical protein
VKLEEDEGWMERINARTDQEGGGGKEETVKVFFGRGRQREQGEH